MAVYEYAIAAGHNNTVGLVNIEDITPAGDRAFYPPAAYNQYNPGVLKLRLDGMTVLVGHAGINWVFDIMTRAQWLYLRNTYTVGGNSYSGKVTIRSRDDGGGYENFNATLLLPKPVDMERAFTAYRRVVLPFIRVTRIAP